MEKLQGILSDIQNLAKVKNNKDFFAMEDANK